MFIVRSVSAIVLVLPCVAAQAQFSVVSQSGAASAWATGGVSQSQSSVPGDLASFKLSVTSGDSTRSFASAGSSTVIEAGKVAISAGTGAKVYPYATGTGYTGYGYGPIYESAYATASVMLTFDVAQSTDVLMAVVDYYRPDRIGSYEPGFNSSLSLSRLDANGTWVAHESRNHLDTLTHLDAGRYQLNAAFSYDLGRPSGLAGGGTSVSITAIPEPTTWGMFGLGLLGVTLASRRARVS